MTDQNHRKIGDAEIVYDETVYRHVHYPDGFPAWHPENNRARRVDCAEATASDSAPASVAVGAHYRSQDYAMCLIDTGRDGDGAPTSGMWTLASEDDYAEGIGRLEIRVHEIVDTERSGTLAVYYKQWIAPDGKQAWGKRPQRRVGSIGSLKSLIRRRKMTPLGTEGGSKDHE